MQFVILLAAFAVLQSGILALGENENVAVAPRPSWTGSRVVGSPEAPPPYTVEPVFTHIKWKNPVFAIREPDSEWLIVIEWPQQMAESAERKSLGGEIKLPS